MREHRDTTPARIVAPDVLEGWPSISLARLADLHMSEDSQTIEIETPVAWQTTPRHLLELRDESSWPGHQVYAAPAYAMTDPVGIWIPCDGVDVRKALWTLRSKGAGMRPTLFVRASTTAAPVSILYFFVSPEDHEKHCSDLVKGQEIIRSSGMK